MLVSMLVQCVTYVVEDAADSRGRPYDIMQHRVHDKMVVVRTIPYQKYFQDPSLPFSTIV
jgi:hypothetical protein